MLTMIRPTLTSKKPSQATVNINIRVFIQDSGSNVDLCYSVDGSIVKGETNTLVPLDLIYLQCGIHLVWLSRCAHPQKIHSIFALDH